MGTWDHADHSGQGQSAGAYLPYSPQHGGAPSVEKPDGPTREGSPLSPIIQGPASARGSPTWHAARTTTHRSETRTNAAIRCFSLRTGNMDQALSTLPGSTHSPFSHQIDSPELVQNLNFPVARPFSYVTGMSDMIGRLGRLEGRWMSAIGESHREPFRFRARCGAAPSSRFEAELRGGAFPSWSLGTRVKNVYFATPGYRLGGALCAAAKRSFGEVRSQAGAWERGRNGPRAVEKSETRRLEWDACQGTALLGKQWQCACERVESVGWKSPPKYGLYFVTEGNCVLARGGGEQPEVNS